MIVEKAWETGLLVIDGKAVGGISAPYTKESLMGMPWPLDGKTLDKLKKDR